MNVLCWKLMRSSHWTANDVTILPWQPDLHFWGPFNDKGPLKYSLEILPFSLGLVFLLSGSWF
jgi:hypothetical protein